MVAQGISRHPLIHSLDISGNAIGPEKGKKYGDRKFIKNKFMEKAYEEVIELIVITIIKILVGNCITIFHCLSFIILFFIFYFLFFIFYFLSTTQELHYYLLWLESQEGT